MAQLSVQCSSFQLYYVWNSSMAFQSRAECAVTFAGMPAQGRRKCVGRPPAVVHLSNCITCGTVQCNSNPGRNVQ